MSSLAFLWAFLPLLGAAVAHGPVLRFNLLRPLARPIDFGATWRGARIFGDNKTWRGFLVMSSGIFLATLGLSRIPLWRAQLPPGLAAHPVAYGALLGLGAVVAELPNSFLKRRLRIAPGSQKKSPLGVLLSIYDQGDFVLGVWIFLAPLWLMTPLQAALAFATVVAIHLIVNLIGYAIGARKTLV